MDQLPAVVLECRGVALGNPFGGFGLGWDGVVEQLDRAASYYQDGEATSVDTISQSVGQDLASECS